MSFIYVTGIAGAGKSEVCKELSKLGYEAHEADENLSYFYNNDTGERVARITNPSERTREWQQNHTWKMSKDKLLEIKDGVKDKPVFICGVAANEKEYIDIFDKIIALTIDADTLIWRIETRTGGSNYGKNSLELEQLIERQKSREEYYRKIGAHIIDATRPLEVVVQEIVASIQVVPEVASSNLSFARQPI